MKRTIAILAVLTGAACASGPEPAPQVTAGELKPVLGPNDVVEVRVFGEPDLSGVHQVGADGTLRLPLIGEVAVNGLEPNDAQLLIQTRYNEAYLKNAQVSLLVKKFNSRRVYVLGQVKNPGNYDYQEGMTVIAAIAEAGGATRLGDLNRTLVTRGNGDAQRKISIDVNDIQRGDKPDVELVPGDIVFVPESYF